MGTHGGEHRDNGKVCQGRKTSQKEVPEPVLKDSWTLARPQFPGYLPLVISCVGH